MVANFDGNVRRLRVTEWYRYAQCTCSLAYRYLTEYRSVHVRQQCINSCLSLSVLACQQRPSVSPGSRPLSANQNNIRSNSILLELTGTRPGPTGRLGCRLQVGHRSEKTQRSGSRTKKGCVCGRTGIWRESEILPTTRRVPANEKMKKSGPIKPLMLFSITTST